MHKDRMIQAVPKRWACKWLLMKPSAMRVVHEPMERPARGPKAQKSSRTHIPVAAWAETAGRLLLARVAFDLFDGCHARAEHALLLPSLVTVVNASGVAAAAAVWILTAIELQQGGRVVGNGRGLAPTRYSFIMSSKRCLHAACRGGGQKPVGPFAGNGRQGAGWPSLLVLDVRGRDEEDVHVLG